MCRLNHWTNRVQRFRNTVEGLFSVHSYHEKNLHPVWTCWSVQRGFTEIPIKRTNSSNSLLKGSVTSTPVVKRRDPSLRREPSYDRSPQKNSLRREPSYDRSPEKPSLRREPSYDRSPQKNSLRREPSYDRSPETVKTSSSNEQYSYESRPRINSQTFR